MDLILADIRQEPLDSFANSLEVEGHTVLATLAGDIGTAEYVRDLAKLVRSNGILGALLHTAGLARFMADWQTVLRVNLVGTVLLLDAIEPLLTPGCVAVMVASQAGHVAQRNPEIDAILADTLAPDIYERIEPLFEASPEGSGHLGMGWAAYAYGKRAMIKLAENRAEVWGERGARICTISPGLIRTPMGIASVKASETANMLLEKTPVGRWGTPIDIARTARFLTSNAAGFISGCDIRVDGGVTPAMCGSLF